jgi:tetratricopeptide (TPR) repeat protein
VEVRLNRPARALLIFLVAFLAAVSPCEVSFSQDASSRETEDFDYANGLFSRGMYDFAVDAYRDFVRSHPASGYVELAKYRVGECFFLANKYEEALNQFGIFIQQYPTGDLSRKADLRRGQIFSLKGDYARAEQLLAPMALDLTGESSTAAKYYLGSMYLKKGDYTTAENMLSSVVVSQLSAGYKSFAYMNLGDIYVGRENYLRAASAYDDAMKSAKNASTAAQATLRMANAYYMAGDYPKAAGFYRKTIDDPEASGFFEDAAVGLLSSMYNAKEYDSVIGFWETFLDRAETDEVKAEIMHIAANSYFAEENYAAAAGMYANDYALYPATKYGRRAGLDEKYALYKHSRLDECLAGLETFIASDANQDMRDEAMYLKAKTLAAMGRKDEAITLYNAVSETYKDSAFNKESLYDKAWLAEGSSQTQQGAIYFEEFAGKYPDDPRSPAALLKAAQDNLSIKRFKEAETDYARFLEVFASSPLREKVLYQMGMLYLIQEDYDKAIEYYSLFIKEYPSSSGREGAVYSIAQANMGKQEWDKAIEGFSSITGDPSSELYDKAMESLAHCYFEKGDQARTAETFRSLMAGRPAYKLKESIYQWATEYYLKKGEPARSIEVLEARQKAYPEAVLDGVISYMYGENYRKTGQTEKAAEYFGKAIAANVSAPFLERAHIGMGNIYADRGEFDKAFEEYSKALEGNRDNLTNSMARMEMGNVKYKMMEYSAAAKEYMMVAILYDDEDVCSKALFRAADSFEKSGAADKAAEALKELVARYPDCEFAKKAAEEIGRLKK